MLVKLYLFLFRLIYRAVELPKYSNTYMFSVFKVSEQISGIRIA